MDLEAHFRDVFDMVRIGCGIRKVTGGEQLPLIDQGNTEGRVGLSRQGVLEQMNLIARSFASFRYADLHVCRVIVPFGIWSP